LRTAALLANLATFNLLTYAIGAAVKASCKTLESTLATGSTGLTTARRFAHLPNNIKNGITDTLQPGATKFSGAGFIGAANCIVLPAFVLICSTCIRSGMRKFNDG
jgi:hypothetical protein